MSNHVTVLDQLLVVSLNINIWSGRKKLTREDLRLPDGTLPPDEDIISLGSKKIADPEKINELETLRRAAHRACANVGIKFLGGYGTPEAKLQAIVAELDEIGQKFNAARQELIANYDDLTLGWIEKHPAWEEILRKAITPVEVVEKRTKFDFTVYQVGAPAGINLPEAMVTGKVAGLADQLLEEIADEARDLMDRSVLVRQDQTITQRALGAIRRMRDKMDGLSFLAGWVTPLVEELDQIMGTMPKQGSINGSEYRHLLSMLMVLQSPEQARQLGEGIASRDDMYPEILLLGTVAPATAAPVVVTSSVEDADTTHEELMEVIPPEVLVHSTENVVPQMSFDNGDYDY